MCVRLMLERVFKVCILFSILSGAKMFSNFAYNEEISIILSPHICNGLIHIYMRRCLSGDIHHIIIIIIGNYLHYHFKLCFLIVIII